MPHDPTEMRHLVSPRAEWPKHDPFVVVLPAIAWDPKLPPHYVLGPWQQWDTRWWSWCRWLTPRSRYRDRLLAARIHVNGGGFDNELRFDAYDYRSDRNFGASPIAWGCNNSYRMLPEHDPFVPHRNQDGAELRVSKRLFGSRGVYPAEAGDVPVLMAFCDRMIARFYGPEYPECETCRTTRRGSDPSRVDHTGPRQMCTGCGQGTQWRTVVRSKL